MIMFVNCYDGFISPVGVGMLAGGAFAVATFMYFVSIALGVLEIVARWFTYKKMGVPGWKSIIPFYNDYVLADKVSDDGVAAWFVLCEAVLCLSTVMLSGVSSRGSMAGMVLTCLSMLSAIATIVLMCVVYHRLSQGFGHGAGYTVGLILLPFVFFPILGFSRAESFDAARIPEDDGEPAPSASADDSGEKSAK